MVDIMLFHVDTSAPPFCIGDKVFETDISHYRPRSILIIDSQRDFKFRDTLVIYRGKVDLMLSNPGSTLDITVILDVDNVEIPPMLVQEALEGINSLVENTANHL